MERYETSKKMNLECQSLLIIKQRTQEGVAMKFRVCLLSIFFCLLSAVQVDAGQNSNAVISLDYVASGQGNHIDNGVTSGTVSGRGTTVVVEVFARNVSTSLSAVEILFKSNSVLTYVGAENPQATIPLNLANGVALAFTNPITPSASGSVFLAKAEFTTLVDVSNTEFKIGIEKVKLVENINNLDEITSGDEIVFNRSATNSGSNRFQIVWPMDGDINYDGQVDIPDFLLLVDNFGKTGTVPTSRMAIENALATGGSGTVVTIRDTIYQTRTVRDTIEVQVNTGGDSPELARAKKLLNMWRCNASFVEEFYAISRVTDQTLDDGELLVIGGSRYGTLLAGSWNKELRSYFVLHVTIIGSRYGWVFTINGDSLSGDLYFYLSANDENPSVYSMSGSGVSVSGWTNYASKMPVLQKDPETIRKMPPAIAHVFGQLERIINKYQNN